jgi:hypothetical protein
MKSALARLNYGSEITCRVSSRLYELPSAPSYSRLNEQAWAWAWARDEPFDGPAAAAADLLLEEWFTAEQISEVCKLSGPGVRVDAFQETT